LLGDLLKTTIVKICEESDIQAVIRALHVQLNYSKQKGTIKVGLQNPQSKELVAIALGSAI
jgi:hypothetical protein